MDHTQHFIDQSLHYLVEDYPKRIIACLEKLNEQQVWWRPNQQSNSVGNLILHLAGNTGQWIHEGIGGFDFDRKRDLEFSAEYEPNKKELLSILTNSLHSNKSVLNSLSSARLEEELSIQGFEVTVRLALYHAVEHYSMHTGQVVYITKMLTGEPLNFYSITESNAKPTWKSTGI